MLAHLRGEFLAPLRINIKLMLDVGERLHQFLLRSVTVEPRQRRVGGDEMPVARGLEDALDRVLVDGPVFLLGLPQRLLRLLELRDVARKTDHARHRPGLRNDGHLGHGGPDLAAVRGDLAFELVDERLAREQDALLVVEVFLRLLARMKIEVRLPHHRARLGHAEPFGHRPAATQEARMNVLEVDAVGNVVEQRAQQIPLIGQFLLDAPACRHIPEDSLHADDLAREIVERRLDDVDETFLPLRRVMRLDGVQMLLRGHHPQIIAMIFGRQVAREEIEVRFAHDFAGRAVDRLAEFLIREREAPFRVLAQNVLRQRLDQRLVEDLGCAQLLLDALVFLDAAGQLHQMPPQLQVRHHLVHQDFQRLRLRGCELARFAVDHAQRPQAKSFRRGERRAGVEADVRRAGDERIVGKPFVSACVLHHEQFPLQNGVRTKRRVARRLGQLRAVMRLEPLAMFVEQDDERDARATEVGGETGQIVEGRFGFRVEDVIAAQRGQALRFIGRERCGFHNVG